MKNQTTSSQQTNKIENKNQKKLRSRKRIGFDPLIKKMIQHNNVKNIKKFMVLSFIEYLPFKEVLQLRKICTLFDSAIKDKFKFLTNKNLLIFTKRDFNKIKIEHKIDGYEQLLEENSNNQSSNEETKFIYNNVFNNETTPIKTFSKQQMFYKMVQNKEYASLKQKIRNGELKKPKNFYI